MPLQVGLALHVEKSSAWASKAVRLSGDSSIPFSRMHLAKISFVEWTKETALPLRQRIRSFNAGDAVRPRRRISRSVVTSCSLVELALC